MKINKEITEIKNRFPLLAEKIIEVCEERSEEESVNAYRVFLDLADIFEGKVVEALELLQIFTASSLDALEEI